MHEDRVVIAILILFAVTLFSVFWAIIRTNQMKRLKQTYQTQCKVAAEARDRMLSAGKHAAKLERELEVAVRRMQKAMQHAMHHEDNLPLVEMKMILMGETLGTTDTQVRYGAVHTHFGLTYASWLVLPRVLLQAMSDRWQYAFVSLLTELDEAFPDWGDDGISYSVSGRDNGKFKRLPEHLSNYRRPDVVKINSLCRKK